MKKIAFYLILIIIPIIIISGCKKALTEHPKSFVSPSNFFQTADEDEAAVNAVYSVLYDFFSNWQFLEVTDGTSDLMWANVGSTFDGTFSYDPSAPGFGASIWEDGYQGILYANNAIYGIAHSPVDTASKKSMIAEAKFLRALYYFFLTNTFNDVPYWSFPLNTEARVTEVSKLPRKDATAIRDSLIADLQSCANDLPLKQTGDNTGRITQGAALALLQKIALFNKKWQIAIDAGEQIVQENKYQLLPNYADIFDTKNNAESIFEIQYDFSISGGIQRSQSIPSYCMPSRHKKGTTVYDGVDLGTKAATTYGDIRPTHILVGLYTDSMDTRKNVVLGYGYNGQVFNLYKTTGMPWLGPKFWYLSVNNLASGKNLRYLRYADVLLMLAEAYNETGNTTKSLVYLNQVRERAHIPDFVSADQDSLRQVIRDERGWELAGEYQRRWNLIRWGIWYDALKKTAQDNPNGAPNLKPYKQYYPIPENEIIKNENLKQNPGY
jgi:hypothetical protein